MTGSLPGLNLAVYADVRAVGAEPIAITSVGASTFGATDPQMTWLDMERWRSGAVVAYARSLPRSAAAATSRGLSPSGRQLLLDATTRNQVRLLETPGILEAVKERVALYDSVSLVRGRPIKLYVNVGGGIVSLWRTEWPTHSAGLTRRLASRSYPNRGVINVMAERGLPVVHLLQVERAGTRLRNHRRRGRGRPPGEGTHVHPVSLHLWSWARRLPWCC